MEILDIYDKDANKTGKTVNREDIDNMKEGDYIVVPVCLIVNLDGKILLTQRSYEKDGGGLWEPTKGALRSGEKPIDGMRRELQEEIGLTNSDGIRMIGKLLRHNKIYFIYELKKDIKIEDLSFTDNEVMGAKYVSEEEYRKMAEDGLLRNKAMLMLLDVYKEKSVK